jgi:hypothetical protein
MAVLKLPPTTTAKLTFTEKLQLADLIVKGMGAILLIVGGYVTVAKFLDDQRTNQETAQRQQEAELEQRKKEFKIKFYEQQIALYAAICDAAAKVATCERLDEVHDELRAFNALYWGKLCIVESPTVEIVQRKIHDELAKLDRSDLPPPQELKLLCYQLAHACRDDLEEVFNPKLGKLPIERKAVPLSQLPIKLVPAKHGKTGAKTD